MQFPSLIQSFLVLNGLLAVSYLNLGTVNALPIPMALYNNYAYPAMTSNENLVYYLDACKSNGTNPEQLRSKIGDDGVFYSDPNSTLCLYKKPTRTNWRDDSTKAQGSISVNQDDDDDESSSPEDHEGLMIWVWCAILLGFFTITFIVIFEDLPDQIKNFQRVVSMIKRDGEVREQSKARIYLRTIFGVPCHLGYLAWKQIVKLWGRIFHPVQQDQTTDIELVENEKGEIVVTRTQINNYKFLVEELVKTAQLFMIPTKDQYTFQSHKDLIQSENKLLKGQASCPICIEEYKDSDFLIILPCEHTFHYICMDEMRKSNIETLNSPRSRTVPSDKLLLRCPTCKLNLIRFHQYLVKHKLDPANVKFDNKN
ncbi:putative membrane protein [Wickerhamomyces ciferrii]|uniref:RING-type E3 ubiquitin transferase n=1 Tax=Wickerhamomyces ciferrii (strain ATCC 14091 / BCRC 22168 / CBS 111 / JCM 3599 / NBRC 0793 / NRRL Y-1031 F-60-10) TaxID=1206466 RepID=K0KJH9_WICCF|nr:uncharacterized protein BN7_4992 [Wickerhamomyces ciferrii]CCH45410.1 putative membrane protein [Wickerhamomyces ciferrii]